MTGSIGWFDTHKPAASRGTHLLCAAMMWSIVGTALLGFGVYWTVGSAGVYSPWLLLAAGIVGLVKARFVLRRSAHRIARRILHRGDGHCLGGFLSWRLWLLVAVMATAGRMLRMTSIPRWVIGVVYASVGVALLAGSCSIWSYRLEAP